MLLIFFFFFFFSISILFTVEIFILIKNIKNNKSKKRYQYHTKKNIHIVFSKSSYCPCLLPIHRLLKKHDFPRPLFAFLLYENVYSGGSLLIINRFSWTHCDGYCFLTWKACWYKNFLGLNDCIFSCCLGNKFQT